MHTMLACTYLRTKSSRPGILFRLVIQNTWISVSVKGRAQRQTCSPPQTPMQFRYYSHLHICAHTSQRRNLPATMIALLFSHPGGEKLQNNECVPGMRRVVNIAQVVINVPVTLASRISRMTCTATFVPKARSFTKQLHFLRQSAVVINSEIMFSSHNYNLSCKQSIFRAPPCWPFFTGVVSLVMFFEMNVCVQNARTFIWIEWNPRVLLNTKPCGWSKIVCQSCAHILFCRVLINLSCWDTWKK